MEPLFFAWVSNNEPGVLLSITGQSGAITDVHVVDEYGPAELGAYTVGWVRVHWQLKPNLTGTYRVSVYYDYYPRNH